MADSVKPLVSIIVPIFNVENYIDECLESITTQSYKNIEIILVDDASSDSSSEKSDDWATKDSRITVVHKKKNAGLNMARKTGFDASHGQYITFLDSDDLFHKDNVSESLGILNDTGVDIVIYASKEFSDKTRKYLPRRDDSRSQIKKLTNKADIAEYAFFGDGNFPGVQYVTVWGKLYDRKIVERIDWDVANYRFYEDGFWTPQALLESNSITILTRPLMYYRRNIGYGVSGENLGNRLSGNSMNGKSIGYMELIEEMEGCYLELSRKHGFNAKYDERIRKQSFLSKVWRIDNLARAGLLEAENNNKFVSQVLSEYINSKNEHIGNLDTMIKNLNRSLSEIKGYLAERDQEVLRLGQKLEELSGIRRSAKLLIGNIKRRATKPRS